ncbi:hypothetical protein D3C87_2016170 [compost metagenome]
MMHRNIFDNSDALFPAGPLLLYSIFGDVLIIRSVNGITAIQNQIYLILFNHLQAFFKTGNRIVFWSDVDIGNMGYF